MAYYVTGTVDRCPQFREINFPLLRDKPTTLLSPISLSRSLYSRRYETFAATIRKILIDNGTELLRINLRGYVFVAISSVSKRFAPPPTNL